MESIVVGDRLGIDEDGRWGRVEGGWLGELDGALDGFLNLAEGDCRIVRLEDDERFGEVQAEGQRVMRGATGEFEGGEEETIGARMVVLSLVDEDPNELSADEELERRMEGVGGGQAEDRLESRDGDREMVTIGADRAME